MTGGRVQSVALGEADADLVVRGGRVYVPERRELLARDVAVVDGRVAALPEDASDVDGPKTDRVDADGAFVLPGFVDAHTHVDIHHTFERSYHRYLEAGTTSLVSETSSVAGNLGPAGVREFLRATASLPVSVFATVPPQPLYDLFSPPRATDEEAAAYEELLADDRVVGVGESDWIHVVGRDTAVTRLYDRARAEGKRVVGHGAGCNGDSLAAFASVVDDDHEAITPEGFLARLENGVHVVGRSGAIRDDSDAIAGAVLEAGADDASLSTDGSWPQHLDTVGMATVVRRVVREGVDPLDAVRMASYNAARHFGLDDRGSPTPGNVADLVVVPDLDAMDVECVVADGEVVVRDGEATVGPRPHEYPPACLDCVSLPTDSETFRVPASVARDGAVRAIEYDSGLLSFEATVEPPVEGDHLHADPENDVALVSLLDSRRGADGSFTGFLTGFGLREGAVATSITWEQPAVCVVGVDAESMARAVEAVDDRNGAWVVVRDGEVAADLPLPVGGVCADLPLAETVERYEAVLEAIRDCGVDVERPLLALQTLTFQGVPGLKLTPDGYADTLKRERRGLPPE